MQPNIKITPEFNHALALIGSGENVFIHGRPGTGKSTFIHLLRKKLYDRGRSAVVIAPTGIAAINIKGQTIHSMFYISPYDMHKPLETRYKYALLKKLRDVDVIIIDEVSMVRADLFDAVDKRMRDIFEDSAPFAGKQLVLVGDLYQLDPIIDEESDLVQDRDFITNYGAPNSFVFNARAFEKLNLKHVNFTEIFRQKEQDFIKHLDVLRCSDGAALPQTVEFFNKRVADVQPDDIISLCARKRDAEAINQRRLAALPGKEHLLKAISSDDNTGKQDWAEKNCPAPKELKLKIGAAVMITKNDDTSAKRYVNGTIGRVARVVEDKEDITQIEVELEDETVAISKETWYKMKLDNKGRQVEDVERFYIQFPLQLAWATTIHKSQGLTLKNAFIDLGTGAFAAGQTYVALSRIRSIEGLHLKRPLRMADVILHPTVIKFFSHCKFEVIAPLPEK